MAVECRYGVGDKSRVIGWLHTGPEGFLRYHKADTATLKGGMRIVWKPWGLK